MVNRKKLSPTMLLLLSALLFLAIAWLAFSSSAPKQELYMSGDLNHNGIQEEYVLSDCQLVVSEASSQLWQSPKEYRIDSFSLGDVTNDGTDKLVMSLWKSGSFGEMKPFWHTKKDNDYKNHLFVYELEATDFKQVWCSSNLARPIVSFAIADTDGDSLKELVVTEGQYKKVFGSKYAQDPTAQEEITLWEWDEWGFSLKTP